MILSPVRLLGMGRQRMSGKERREQLISIGRATFSEKGFDGTSVEEVAARAGVSKPVVYEHFGGKEGLYAVIVDRELLRLEALITGAIGTGRWRDQIESACVALLTYVEEETDGFVILVRDSAQGEQGRNYGTLFNSAVSTVSRALGSAFEHRGLDSGVVDIYAQALVGMVTATAQWWLDVREPDKQTVAAHIVNLCWNGLSGLQETPKLRQYAEETKTEDPLEDK